MTHICMQNVKAVVASALFRGAAQSAAAPRRHLIRHCFNERFIDNKCVSLFAARTVHRVAHVLQYPIQCWRGSAVSREIPKSNCEWEAL
ncbi:hypothetical protein MPC1_5810003 [Methylocella tundrae]|nr:hypothetical protein MPC1_5810003 [Methylocella tundrae]